MHPGLYLVSTPIGNSRDITLRAIDMLSQADVLACEDTRQTKKLLQIHGISLESRVCLSYNEYTSEKQINKIISYIKDGKSVVLVCDAGTPIISDPGHALVKLVKSEGLEVFSVPGPCALISALTLSGLPAKNFMFCGFPPRKTSKRLKFFVSYKNIKATLIFYESPRRILSCLQDLLNAMGDHEIAVAREITKRFEEVLTGKISEVIAKFNNYVSILGEIVLIVDNENFFDERVNEDGLCYPLENEEEIKDFDDLIISYLDKLPVKGIVTKVIEHRMKHGLPTRKKKDIYKRILELKRRFLE